MAPTLLIPDVWEDQIQRDSVSIDVLLPNGYLMNIDVKKDATLAEIKEDVWDAAQQCPLFGLLRDGDSYVFQCINLGTAELEELVDEDRKLCDVKPFQAVLKLVERQGDEAEKILNSRIRALVGKGYHGFDKAKNSEVYDFRKQMKMFCESVTSQLDLDTLEKRILCQYPVSLESVPELPQYLQPKLHDGKLVLAISMEHQRSESTFKFSVLPTINAKGLFELVLSKKGPSIGLQKNSLKNYLLKICGLEEYLIGTHPLSQYKYIQESLSNDKIPELVLVSCDSVQLELNNEDHHLERQRSRSITNETGTLTKRKKQTTVSTWSIEDPFSLCIHNVHKLNYENKIKVAVKCGLYHGEEMLCSLFHTADKCLEDGSCVWEETVQFDIAVCNLPRMTKLCLCVYELSPIPKNSRFRKCQDSFVNPIAWVNTMVFDYKGHLKSTPITLMTWPYTQETDDYSLLKPLGWVSSNPNKDEAAAITISIGKYHEYAQLVYPSLEKILEYAEKECGEAVPMPQASKSHLEQLRQICEKDSLYQLHEQEKELMWFLRKDCCVHLPNSLPKLLRSVKWNDRKDVAQMIALLHEWPRLSPDKALELLDYALPEQTGRSFAVDCLKDISDEELSLYLLQLVQALKHEAYLQNDLVKFLLKRSLLHRHSGHRLFWLLRSEMHFPEVSTRFGLVLEAYCRAAPSHLKALEKQVEAVAKLKTANKMVQNDNCKRKENREKMKCVMQELLAGKNYQVLFKGLHNPLDPRYKFGKIRVEKCKFLDSKMRPLWLAFENTDSYGKDVFIIFKNGDDLRQDMLTLQMIRIMDKLWKEEGLDLR